jgi:hypothetical protein
MQSAALPRDSTSWGHHALEFVYDSGGIGIGTST